MAAEPVQKLFQDGSLPANQGTDTEYQLLEGAKAGDMELVKKICSGIGIQTFQLVGFVDTFDLGIR